MKIRKSSDTHARGAGRSSFNAQTLQGKGKCPPDHKTHSLAYSPQDPEDLLLEAWSHAVLR